MQLGTRMREVAILTTAISLLAAAHALAQRDGVWPDAPSDVSGKPPAATQRFREGTNLTDQAGQFQLVGDRVVFVFDGADRQLTALENLALERVARAVRQSSSTQTWLVSGIVTEYRGGNFLLLERAVIRREASE